MVLVIVFMADGFPGLTVERMRVEGLGLSEPSRSRLLQTAEELGDLVVVEVQGTGFLEEAAGGGFQQGKTLLERRQRGSLNDHPHSRPANQKPQVLELLQNLVGGGG